MPAHVSSAGSSVPPTRPSMGDEQQRQAPSTNLPTSTADSRVLATHPTHAARARRDHAARTGRVFKVGWRRECNGDGTMG